MVRLHLGGKRGRSYELLPTNDFLVLRTRQRLRVSRAPVSARGRNIIADLEEVVRFPSAGVEIMKNEKGIEARSELKKEPAFEFVGRALVDPATGSPAAYTENIFLKFHDDLAPGDVARQLTRLKYGLTVKRPLEFARNAFFLEAPNDTGLAVFEIAEELLALPEVQLCHPEVVRERVKKHAYPPQWHLFATTIGTEQVKAHAHVVEAWEHSRGKGITVAVIDDGVDITHPEFDVPDKIIKPRDVTRNSNNARPRLADDNHGTACAGVAVAAGIVGASGVAPEAQLMPIRLSSGLGSMDEAEAFYWAAKNGADVISCSWGPDDGDWADPDDPLHGLVVPLPDNTRLAIDAAADEGRNGRGAVILFAAGNGNERVDNDGYASYSKVIAVAACNDRGKRAAYSDHGAAIWCAFPSDHGEPSLTPGIWTTDRTGSLGYNHGDARLGDAAGLFANDFGGTSSACPGAAGIAALVLSANPWLKRKEVRDILKDCCDKIDKRGGAYDAAGRSAKYGWGRLNAERAVLLALGKISPPGPPPGRPAKKASGPKKKAAKKRSTK